MSSFSYTSLDDLKKKYGQDWEDQDYNQYMGVQDSVKKAQDIAANVKAKGLGVFKAGAGYSYDDYLKERQTGKPGTGLYKSFMLANPQFAGAQGLITGNQAFKQYSDQLNRSLMDYDFVTKDVENQTRRLGETEKGIAERNKARLDKQAADAYQLQNAPRQGAVAMPGGIDQEAGFVPRTQEQVAQMQSMEDAVGMWENVFGKGEQKAFAAANDALGSEISSLQRRQQELSAQSGRSALGGGFQAGAAQAALSAGGLRSKLQSDFYQNKQSKKQSFLQSQLDRAEREGRSEDARQLSLLLANIDLEGSLGNAEAMSEYYDQLLNGVR